MHSEKHGSEDETAQSSSDEGRPRRPRIIVVGVGSAGGNALNRIIRANIAGVEFVAANTDVQALQNSIASTKLQMGARITNGLGCGATPERGRQAALDDTERILELLEGADMVIVAAGMGGGTGTGAAPIIASLAKELGALTVGVVSLPFGFEGRKRQKNAENGIHELGEVVDTLITIPNEKLLSAVGKEVLLEDIFRYADDALCEGIQSILGMITMPGIVNIDVADFRAVMSEQGEGMMGIGIAEGENRAVEAARRAVSSPLLEGATIRGAANVLINITASRKSLKVSEVSDAAKVIGEETGAEITFGTTCDEGMGESIKVTLIATGFSQNRAEKAEAPKERPVELYEPLQPDPAGDELDLPAYLRKRPKGETDRLHDTREPGPGTLPGGNVDRVHFSVTAPPRVQSGNKFILDVWAHLECQREEVIKRAMQGAADGKVAIQSQGPVRVARGTDLIVHLTIEGLTVDEPQKVLLWEGEIGNAKYFVTTPPDAPEGVRHGVATIHASGLQVTRFSFSITIARQGIAVSQVPIREERHKKAFASYASADREQVLARLQGMQKIAPTLEITMDVITLRSGEYWERVLWQVIPASDVFYLFWSQHAKNSDWVEKEWRCALQERGLDFIDPVPLVSPEEVPPPPELASKHFNDWVLAWLRNSAGNPGSQPPARHSSCLL